MNKKHQKTQAAVTEGGSAIRRYQDLIIGRRGVLTLLYFEWCVWVGALPGAAGLMMRKLFWPRLFGGCGSGTVFGARVTLRHPHRIYIGDNCVISDGCILEARTESEIGITIDSNTILSNDVMLSCKNGTIHIGQHVGVGAQSIMHAVNGSKVEIGNDVLIGPRCYFAGGGNYNTDRIDIPISKQGLKEEEQSVTLDDDIWLGANVSVMPNVSIGRGSIIAAGAVLTSSIPDNCVAAGVPAKIVRRRDNNE